MRDLARHLLGRARALESRLARGADRTARRLSGSGAREPLEIAHAIADAVEDRVEPSGRGRHVFPFAGVRVVVAAPTREARARFDAVFDGAWPLRERIVQRLAAAGCPVADLRISVAYAAQAKAGWTAPDFHLAFLRREARAAEPARPPAPPRLDVIVLAGVAERATYSFAQPRVDIGRCAQVRDSRQRPLRTNHVAFADDAGAVNESVSRQHAHIAAAPDGTYRIFDERSAQGTSVLREGRTLPVPPGTRGVRLQADDEVLLGRARLKIVLGEPG